MFRDTLAQTKIALQLALTGPWTWGESLWGTETIFSGIQVPVVSRFPDYRGKEAKFPICLLSLKRSKFYPYVSMVRETRETRDDDGNLTELEARYRTGRREFVMEAKVYSRYSTSDETPRDQALFAVEKIHEWSERGVSLNVDEAEGGGSLITLLVDGEKDFETGGTERSYSAIFPIHGWRERVTIWYPASFVDSIIMDIVKADLAGDEIPAYRITEDFSDAA